MSHVSSGVGHARVTCTKPGDIIQLTNRPHESQIKSNKVHRFQLGGNDSTKRLKFFRDFHLPLPSHLGNP